MLRMRQRPLCLTRKTVETLPLASLTVAVAFAALGTVTFCTTICAVRENTFFLTSLAQLPLAAAAVTELASFGVKICVQISLPLPARLAVWRSASTRATAVFSALGTG